ncbi:MAG TPA: outer membrane lipoprotein chaperone LolA [Usitatibacter sp.]|nr:outer membrane lipoprotein chaperone LolA [Usitatibacter sp.]
MRLALIGAMLALAASLSPSVRASGLDDFLAFNGATKSATAIFEQQAFDRSGQVVDRSSGTFAFARPGKFRWAYEKPHQELLVADGAKLWIYDPDLQQVTVKRIDQAISSTPAALLAGKDDITKLFTLRDAGSKDGLAWVEALPKSKDTGFDRVRLGMQGRTLAAMELYDQLGGHTVLRFSDLKANVSLPAETFRFTPPKGADVIDEDAAAKR